MNHDDDRFSTPCFHPNVDNHGNICLDILKEKWWVSYTTSTYWSVRIRHYSYRIRSALYEVRTILLSIQSLLAEPNNDSPLNTHAAELWSNQAAFKKYLYEKYEKDSKTSAQ